MTRCPRPVNPTELAPRSETKSYGCKGNGSAYALSVGRLAYEWAQLPEAFRRHGKCVLFRIEQGRKIPYRPNDPTRRAAINMPETWTDFDQAVRAYERFPSFHGINGVCSPEFTFVDIDDCIDLNGQIAPAAQRLMDNLPITYWEKSPSQTGLHGIFQSQGNVQNIAKHAGAGFELYSGRHFMSVTGWVVRRNPIGPLSPDHLKRWLKTKISARAPTATERAICRGSRSNALMSLGGALLRKGASPEALKQAIDLHNIEHCSPPLEERRIAGILKSLEKYRTVGDLLSQEFQDVGNADRLILWGKGDFRFIPAFGHWTVFDGVRWPVEDREQEIIRIHAHMMFRAFGVQAVEAANEKAIKYAAGCLSSARIRNAMREAQPHAILTVAAMDHDALLVNFLNGTLDARTGELRDHRREDFITAVIQHNFNPQATCPRWTDFVSETFNGDREQIEFVQRALGYSLTGDTSEKCLFLAYGPTDTGKTTLLNIVGLLLGDYAGQIKVESLMVQRGRPIDSNAQADLADLRATRFARTSETGEAHQLREELIKVLCQGQGMYRAVRKYENPFEFPETWKIWLDCNHLPVVRGTDDAIWGRLVLIPFRRRISKAEQNRNLAKEIVAEEAEGILAWLIRGLMDWWATGLQLPPSIERERAEWRKESDDLGLWLEERCVVQDDASARSSTLYESNSNWRSEMGFRPDSTVIFARKMKQHGFTKKETGKDKAATWYGVGIKDRSQRERIRAEKF